VPSGCPLSQAQRLHREAGWLRAPSPEPKRGSGKGEWCASSEATHWSALVMGVGLATLLIPRLCPRIYARPIMGAGRKLLPDEGG